MKTIRVNLRFPADKSTKPVTSCLIRDYNLVFNILQAHIDMGLTGQLTMELSGDETDLQRGVRFLRSEGVEVTEITHSIEWDGEKCISCGACTAVCTSGALAMDNNWKLGFNAEKCVVCERCLTACPMRVLRLNRG